MSLLRVHSMAGRKRYHSLRVNTILLSFKTCHQVHLPVNISSFGAYLCFRAGVHQYKFIVDGKWRHATDQPIAADVLVAEFLSG